MSMQPSFSSGDVNPFKWIANKLGQYPKESTPEYHHAMALHQAQYAAHQYGIEAESHKAALAEQSAVAAHGRNMEFFGSVLRHAKHETPIHLSIGDTSAQFTKKPKTVRASKPAPTEESKTARPLPVRDPKTGRAMKAPE
jgi:hypothetical protein